MGWLGFIMFVVIFVCSVVSWINSKIILEELAEIRKMLEDRVISNSSKEAKPGDPHNFTTEKK